PTSFPHTRSRHGERYGGRNGRPESICSASLNTPPIHQSPDMPLTPVMSAFGRIADTEACLLYPQKRTLQSEIAMSALCQKRTLCGAVKSPYWITSSAATRSVCGTVMPSALAVLRLIVSKYFTGICTGSSDGFCASQDIVHVAGRTAKIVSEVCGIG